MVENRIKVRVRYCETDQMGIVNNANYPVYYEIGRTELFRELGLSYKNIEDKGVMLPLNDLYVKYKIPALYDDELEIITRIKELPAARIRFDYELVNQDGTTINEGYTTLAFLDAKTRRPMRAPGFILDLLKPYF